MKETPHRHYGQVELCYDQLCARLTTSETNAMLVFGAIAGVFLVAALS